MLLTGTFPRLLDEKLRVAIPKTVRASLGEKGIASMIVAPGTDGSLALYTEESFAKLGERLANGSPTAQEVRTFGRLFYARAQTVEVDGQGRARIPPELAKLAGLDREVVLVGVQDHLELWDRKRWDAYLAQHESQYDKIAEAAFKPSS